MPEDFTFNKVPTEDWILLGKKMLGQDDEFDEFEDEEIFCDPEVEDDVDDEKDNHRHASPIDLLVAYLVDGTSSFNSIEFGSMVQLLEDMIAVFTVCIEAV